MVIYLLCKEADIGSSPIISKRLDLDLDLDLDYYNIILIVALIAYMVEHRIEASNGLVRFQFEAIIKIRIRITLQIHHLGSW